MYLYVHTHTHTHTHTVEPVYNDIGLYDTSPITTDSVVPINSPLLTLTL